MAVPKKRTSRVKRNMRRSHHAAVALRLATCQRCKQLRPMHTACPTCGTYRDRDVINVTKQLDKRERRRREQAKSQAA